MSVKKYVAKSWSCAGCVQVGSMIGDKWEVQEVDIDSLSRDELKTLGIRSVPVLIAFDGEKEVERINGVPSKEKLDQFLGSYATN